MRAEVRDTMPELPAARRARLVAEWGIREDDAKVLVKCQWSSGDKKDVAVSWYRTPGKGRVFYTNFAKIDADLSSETLGKGHILRGLSWVLGRP